jgi:hypothetical protein
MIHAKLPPRSMLRALPASDTGTLLPATYLHLRRVAARLTVDQVAERLAPRARDRAEATALIYLLETAGVRARHTETLVMLAKVFPFDPLVYRQLAEEPADRHPRVCRGCGCSHWDPCRAPFEEEGCAWATLTCCTRCAPEAGSATA